MKNISIQKKPGWSDVHLLINVFRDTNFKKYIGNKEYEFCNSDDINELLNMEGYFRYRTYSLVKAVSPYPTLPINYVIDIISHDNITTVYPPFEYPIVPYFLTIFDKGPRWRTLAVLRIKEHYLLIDSMFEDVIILDSVMELSRHFKQCSSVERFVLKGKNEGGIRCAIMDAEYYGFDKLLK